MDKLGVKYEFINTKGHLDGMHIVMNLYIDQYFAIVAVGGDGTIHEVVNGLLRRKDGKKVPLAFLPNGSGNDCCGSLEIDTIKQGLQYIA